MASRFNPSLAPHLAIIDRNAAGLCALLSCEEAPCLGHSWCSRTHYLLWLTEFTSSLQLDQICMLPGCTRHVFVDDNAPPSRFCGWRHEQKFVMLSALQRHQQEPLPSIEVLPQQPPSPASVSESEPGRRRASITSLMHSLKEYAHSRIAPKNIRVIEDFYEKHPWEIFSEGHACWLIAGLKFTSKGRKLTTKGYYHWKQSGPWAKTRKYTRKYYKYEKRKGKEKEADQQQQAESSYKMKEYTMEDVECYSLIYLVKEKPSKKLGKEQASRKQEIAEQVENVCSQDTVTSKLSLWNDDSSVDSIFRGLASLDGFP